MRGLCSLLIACALLPLGAIAQDVRQFTSSDGVTIKASFVSFEDGKVTIRLAKDGKTYTVPLERLSAEDQTFLVNGATQTNNAGVSTPLPNGATDANSAGVSTPLPNSAPHTNNAGVSTPNSIEPFFENYCYDCHDSLTAKADLDLEELTRSIVDSADALNWQDILDQLNSGEMPPKDKKQPTDEELALVVGDLTEFLQAAQGVLRDSGGEIALRRINRREYEATVKELLGIRIMAGRLPDDSRGRFDTIGQNQSLSSLDLENYFEQAQEVVRTAMHWAVLPREEAKVNRKDASAVSRGQQKFYGILEKVQKVHDTDRSYKEVGLTEDEWKRYNRGSKKYPRHAKYDDRGGLVDYYFDNVEYHALGRMLPIRNGFNHIGMGVQRDARAYYRLRASAGVVDGVETRRSIRMTVPSGNLYAQNGKPIGSFYVTGSIEEPSTHEMVWYPEFEDDFRPATDEEARGRGVTFLEDRRGGPGRAQLFQYYSSIEPDAPKETILLRWMEAEGPFYDEKSPFETLVDTYQVATASDEALDEVAGVFLKQFATAAFRGREVSAEFLTKLLAYYQTQRSDGKSFREAMVDPLALILSSPRFLYLVNPDIGEEEGTRALDAVSLANRLAAFLWSGPPDAELMRVAADGSLLDDAVLLQQTERLLSHPRAKEFYEGFISQWMHLKRFESVGLSSRFLLHYTDAYILSAKQEPVEFFKALVEENLPSANLIDSNFVTIDGVLAAKYGLTDHYTGDGFQKVILPAGSPRGGLTTQAAFLAIGTMGDRTSPVIRGSLVKEVLLNDPPPPPPPNVPELIASSDDPLPSVRSLVELHQKKAQCASCHARFDFIGLGLENFDAVGMWRDKELVTNVEFFHKLKNPRAERKLYPVDASGELPGGETFQDVHGLKKALMKEQRTVAGSVFEGLLCYALGRDVSFTDLPLIDAVLDDLEADQYPVRELVKRVVTSEPFMQR
ncbi:MAG: DUF1592 domain-containing protein [Verrucomicrobiales bacterium]|nr:DUF1592 domain-containing protein [Verrucomicrobiales bacterium]